MSTTDDESGNIPSASECQRRITAFTTLTLQDEAFAQMTLQENDWDLERAVNSYLGNKDEPPKKSETATTAARDGSILSDLLGANVTTKPPEMCRIASWNIDGLDEKCRGPRTQAVGKVIEEMKLDIVLLQEVISETLKQLKEQLPNYQFILPDKRSDYFTAVLVRRFTVYLDSFESKAFANSMMGRGLQAVDCHIGQVKITVLNTHLESTKDYAEARIEQVQECFKKAMSTPEERSVIFAGDLNIRDKEIEHRIPVGMDDLWIRTGSRKECAYTWDMMRNNNLEFPGRFKPRCRFDRMFIKDSNPRRMKEEFFGLLGIEKVPNTHHYPSDHWGIFTEFKIKSS